MMTPLGVQLKSRAQDTACTNTVAERSVSVSRRYADLDSWADTRRVGDHFGVRHAGLVGRYLSSRRSSCAARFRSAAVPHRVANQRVQRDQFSWSAVRASKTLVDERGDIADVFAGRFVPVREDHGGLGVVASERRRVSCARSTPSPMAVSARPGRRNPRDAVVRFGSSGISLKDRLPGYES